MSRFVVVGAGATGSGVANELVSLGHSVTIVTRRGSGPRREGVQLVASDATNADRLSELSRGASAIFNCANPPYHRWPEEWPPLARAMLTAAQESGATLVTLSNLYVYGRPTGPMSPHDPLTADYEKAQVRAKMWTDALAAHTEGRVRAVEVRASDFIGPVENSVIGERVIPRLLAGKTCTVLGDRDALHSWTFIDDVVATLVACACDETSWGRAWHVPSNEPRSSRSVINDLADAAGVPHVGVRSVPALALRIGGLFNPLVRELPKTLYQFEDEFVIDDTETRSHFGQQPTAWNDVLAATLSRYLPGEPTRVST